MKAESSDTGGSVTVFENVLRPHAPGPARHFHRTWTEIFYVLEGKLDFEVDRQLQSASSGTVVFVPRHGACLPQSHE